MADIYSVAKRSEIMAAIRASNTGPEKVAVELLRRAVRPRRLGRRPSLPGRPDIVVPSLRVAVFVDGCFFHVCPQHGHVPKSRRQYWQPKLARNAQRDLSRRVRLGRLGYAMIRIWEHELRQRTIPRTERRVRRRIAMIIDRIERANLAAAQRVSTE